MNNIVSNNTDNTNITLKYKNDIEKLNEQLSISKNRISELNNLLKEYMVNNSIYLKEKEEYDKQIETSEIYKKNTENEIEKLKKELEKCNIKLQDLYKNNNNDSNDNNDKIIIKYKEEEKELYEKIKKIKSDIEILENKKINLDEKIKKWNLILIIKKRKI